MKKAVDISPDIRDLLMRLRIEENIVFIDGQLPRDTYVRLNKVLEALGGKWNRKMRGHVFDGDPVAKIADALETGEAVDVKKTVEFFETPDVVANIVATEADIRDGQLVLEPSAGRGALADVVRAMCLDCTIHVIELEEGNRRILKEKGYKLVGKDFLKYRKRKPLYDRIIMNPPFSRQHDIDHVLHAWRFLRPGGRLVSIMSAGTKWRDNKKAVKFRELVSQYGWFEDLPPGSFEESGTGINTVTVVLDRP